MVLVRDLLFSSRKPINHLPKTKARIVTQALDSFFALGFAITPRLGNKAPGLENLQHEQAIAQNMPLQRSAN